jgi:hypothetical protein
MASAPDPKFDELVEAVIRISHYTEIAHHIPGRIRLKITLAGLPHLQDLNAEALLQRIPGIRQVEIKALSHSVVIHYESKLFPRDLWEGLSKLRHHPERRDEMNSRLRQILARDSVSRG